MSCRIMFRLKASALIALLYLVPAAVALASTVGPVQQVPTVAYIRTHNLTSFPNIHLAGYTVDTDGAGGDFVQIACGGKTDDGGVIFQDSALHCFKRDDIGGGPISARWYGMCDANLNLADLTVCDSRAKMIAALAAAKLYGNGRVDTSGITPAIMTGDLTLAQFNAIDCGGVISGGSDDTVTNLMTRRNSIIHPTTTTINVPANADFSGCYVRPSYFVPTLFSATSTMRDALNYSHLALGTGIVSTGENSTVRNTMITGFDRCLDQANTPRTVVSNLWLDCHIAVWTHAQGGGVKYDNIVRKPFVGAKLTGCYHLDGAGGCSRSGNIFVITYPITNLTVNGAGEIVYTIPTGTPYADNLIAAGDPLSVNGLSDRRQFDVDPVGDIVNGDPILHNVGLNSDGITISGNADSIIASNRAFDNGGAGCLPAGVKVIVTSPNADGSFEVTLDANPTCSATDEPLRFTGTSVANSAGNGFCIAGTVSGQTVACANSNAAGPQYKAGWAANADVISVFDSTNISRNSYLVDPGQTGPFGTHATLTGLTYAATTATNTDIDALLSAGTGVIPVGSTAGWPSLGLCLIGTEAVSCRVKDPTHINILTRGEEATTAANHANGDTITPAAPQVRQIIPSTRCNASFCDPTFVVINVKTTASSGGTLNLDVKFANSQAKSAGTLGQLKIYAAYNYWSTLRENGSAPGAMLFTHATVSNGSTDMTVLENDWKIFPGMTVMVKDHSTWVTGTVSAINKTTHHVTLSIAATHAVISTDTVVFDGAGWDGTNYWLGNAWASDFSCTGNNDVEGQGLTLDWFHPNGSINAFHLKGCPAFSATNYVAANGGSSGCVRDARCTGIKIDGYTDVVQFTNGMIKGVTFGVLNVQERGNDGVSIDNTYFGTEGGVLFANVGEKSRLQITAAHGKSDGLGFQDSRALTLTLAGNDRSRTDIVTDNPIAFRSIICAGNAFRGDVCDTLSVAQGSDKIAVVDTVAILQANPYPGAQTVILKGNVTVQDGRGGIFTLLTPGASDNGTSIICDSIGNCFGRIPPSLNVTSASINPGALAQGACLKTEVTVTGSRASRAAVVEPNTYPGDGFYWFGISGTDKIDVYVCAAKAGTPTASTYKVLSFPGPV